MFYAHGRAQVQAQRNLLLLLYGESRGRAAEYSGPSHLALDPVFRKYVDELTRGINDYTKAHPDSIAAEYRVVLPVSGVDVISHSLRAVHYIYMGSMERVRREVNAAIRSEQQARTITHLAWGDTFYRYMEVHLVGPRVRSLWSAADRCGGIGRRLEQARKIVIGDKKAAPD